MFIAMGATAQNNGGIDAQMLKELTESYKPTAAEDAAYEESRERELFRED